MLLFLTPVKLQDYSSRSPTPPPFTPAANAVRSSTPAPNPVSRKRQRAPSSTPIKSVRKKTTTAREDAFHGLTQSMNHFSDNICKVLAVDPTLRTPHRRGKALALAQKEGWMTMPDKLVFYKVLQKDIAAADAYIALDTNNEEWRHMWITQTITNSHLSL